MNLKLKVAYEGGSADEHKLNLYDAGISLQGLARALNISTHAFLNEEVRSHGDAARGAEIYLTGSRSGSFIVETSIWLANTIAGGLMYEFLKYAFHEAVGEVDALPEPASALQRRIEPTLGELPQALETALFDAHRPIIQSPGMSIKLTRPKGGELIRLDAGTAASLNAETRELSGPIVGNVTRYNSLSRWGKIYSQQDRRVVPFYLLPSVTDEQKALITVSLHQTNTGQPHEIALTASGVVTPHGRTKRYNVSSVTRQS